MHDSVLFAMPGLAFGGAERAAADILKYLADNGVAVGLVSLPRRLGAADSGQAWFEGFCEVERIARGPGMGAAIVEAVARRDVSALVLCGRSPAYDHLPMIVGRHPGLRVSSFIFNARQLVRETRQMAPYIDAVIAENHSAAAALLAGDEARLPVAIVPMGVAVHELAARPRPAPSARLTVGFIGRFDKTKNPHGFMRMARLLRHRDYRFVMAGAAPSRFRAPPGIEYRGLLLGEELQQFVDGIDILVVPSLNDGRPLTIQEALARGIAVVASNVGGIPELIEDEVNGLLCPLDDDQAFAAAVERLAADPDLRHRLGEAGRRRILADGGSATALPRYAEVILGRPLVARTAA